MKRIYIRFFLSFFLLPQFAIYATEGSHFTAVDAGIVITNVKERLSVPEPYPSLVSQMNAVLRVREVVPLTEICNLEPSFATTLPWQTSADGNAKTFTSFLAFDFTVAILNFLKLRTGPGLQWQLFVSSEETIPLNNGGQDTTAAFYSPSGLVNAFILTWNAGLEIDFSSRISLHLEGIGLNILNPARREIHVLTALGLAL